MDKCSVAQINALAEAGCDLVRLAVPDMESAAAGIMAGINAAKRILGEETVILPPENMIGALSRYISDTYVSNFQPMGASFGLLPPLEEKIRDKKERYAALAKRSLDILSAIIIE